MAALNPNRGETGRTMLEPISVVQELIEDLAAQPSSGGPAGGPPRTMMEPLPVGAQMPVAEEAFRPRLRPSVPRVTILDDGEVTQGETVRVRDAITLIGRSEGSLRVPHDPLISSRHAELVREGAKAPYRWMLRDLGSSNGTFVRCGKTVLGPDRLILLGSHRLRFQPPAADPKLTEGELRTVPVDLRTMLSAGCPTLVETTGSRHLTISLTKPLLTVGRPGCGNDIELGDPLIAPRHAEIVLDRSGDWRIEAKPSRNGVWVQIASIRLTKECWFQCGEQRFRFEMR
jgi:pSer/pThr/pTyr-binding forkhead associated (FHA) protein